MKAGGIAPVRRCLIAAVPCAPDPDDAQHARATAGLEQAAAQGRSRRARYGRGGASSSTAGGRGKAGVRDPNGAAWWFSTLPADAAAQLASLRTRTGRRMPDCCVLLAAERTGGAVLSFDEKLRGSAADVGSVSAEPVRLSRNSVRSSRRLAARLTTNVVTVGRTRRWRRGAGSGVLPGAAPF